MAIDTQLPVSWAEEHWHSACCEPREQPCRGCSLVGVTGAVWVGSALVLCGQTCRSGVRLCVGWWW